MVRGVGFITASRSLWRFSLRVCSYQICVLDRLAVEDGLDGETSSQSGEFQVLPETGTTMMVSRTKRRGQNWKIFCRAHLAEVRKLYCSLSLLASKPSSSNPFWMLYRLPKTLPRARHHATCLIFMFTLRLTSWVLISLAWQKRKLRFRDVKSKKPRE